MSYITDLQVSLNADEERNYRKNSYVSVPGNLNEGTGGPKIYLWYQRGSNRSAAITRIQFSFSDQMSESLKKANYQKIDKNLNEKTSGDPIYLWYFRGSTTNDFPIIDLHVTTQTDEEPDMFRLGWKRLACYLNRNAAGGNPIHLWVMQKERTYISDITATTDGLGSKYFNQAYIQLDENTNKSADGPCTFIFYLLTKIPTEAINDVQLYEVPGYTKVEQDLNKVTGGTPLFLWYSKATKKEPIQDLTLILDSERSVYKNAKIPVIDQDINPQGVHEYVSYYQ